MRFDILRLDILSWKPEKHATRGSAIREVSLDLVSDAGVTENHVTRGSAIRKVSLNAAGPVRCREMNRNSVERYLYGAVIVCSVNAASC